MSLTISETRVAQVRRLWEEARAAQVPNAQEVKTMFGVAGSKTDNFSENQRCFAIAQFLFNSKELVEQIAYCITENKVIIASPRAADTVTVPEGVQYIQCDTATANGAFDIFKEALAVGPISYIKRELEAAEGDFAVSFADAINGAEGLQLLDAPAPQGYILATQDALGIECVKKAAALVAATLRKFVIPDLELQLAGGQPRTCRGFSNAIDERVGNPNKLDGLEQMDTTGYDSAFTPSLVQSGHRYNISKITDPALTDEVLSPDCILFAYGAKHGGYTSYVARTVMIESGCPSNMKSIYDFVFAVSAKVQELLVPGALFSDIYTKALAYATELNAELAAKLTPSFGFASGLVVSQGPTTISPKGCGKVYENMAVIVRIGVSDVPAGAAGSTRTLSVLIGDTVLTTADKGCVLLTKTKRESAEMLFREEEQATVESKQRDLGAITRAGKAGGNYVSKEEMRQDKQLKLIIEKHAEWQANGGKGGALTESEDFKVLELGRLAKGDVKSYERSADAPNVPATAFEVDKARKTAWIPIHGVATPFHISTINKVEVKSDATGFYLLVAFFNTLESNIAYKVNRSKIFIKDVSFFSKKSDKFHNFTLAVKEVQAIIKSQNDTRKQRQGIAAQGKLQAINGGPQLKLVKIRPPPSTGRNVSSQGDLQAHANGFRFVCTGMEPIQIMYDNVKHVIYQPSDNDICVIFHLSLKDPIMVGKKKTSEVQFVSEVIETSEGVGGRGRGQEAEEEEEARQKSRITATNRNFYNFANEVRTRFNLSAQLPFRQFDFQGSHARSLTRFKGSDDVIWAINDNPFFVQSLKEVEIVSLERVLPSGSNFDLVLVPPKPYDIKALKTITTIPMASVDAIKDWLTTSKVVCMENTSNIQWTQVLKSIREDAEWEPWGEEGWKSHINPEDSDEEEEDSDESWDSDDEESEDYSDDSGDSDSDWAEEVSESSDDDSDDDSDDESALSWDEMEARAEKADRTKNYSDDDDDKPQKKRGRK